MADSSTHFCKFCQENDVSTLAVSWCLACEDWLCTDCEKRHGRSKISKHHKTIGVDTYTNFPQFVCKFKEQCPEHNHKFEQFCTFHGVPCCIQCISLTHKECELNPLVNVLQNVKESSAIYHLQENLNDIHNNLEVIEKHLLGRLPRISDQKNECLNEIKRVRMTINEHLDEIERDILDELSHKERYLKESVELLASQIDSKKRRIVNLQESLLTTKQYATDLQIFICIKDIEKQMSKEAKYLEDFEKEDHLGNTNLELVISSALQSLAKDVVQFGKISVKVAHSTLKLTRVGQRQAQLSLALVSTLNNIDLVRTLTIKTTESEYLVVTACVILPTGECIFADYDNDRLVLYDGNGTYVRDVIETSGLPADMCYIEDSIVGVSVRYKKKIQLIDVSKNRILKTLQLESDPYGIDCYNDKLFARLPLKYTVIIMDLDGEILQCLYIPENGLTRIACNENYIYCLNWKTDEVLCYGMNGKMIWRNKYGPLISPQSITIDKKSGIIYVSGFGSNNLLAISLDGNQSKIVLSAEHGLTKPRSICVNTNNKLLVCNDDNGFAFVYKL